MPVSTIYNNPVAATSNNVLLLTHDQCGVTAQTASGDIYVQNIGKGQLSINATLQSTTNNTTTPTIGGGAGQTGGGFGGGLRSRGFRFSWSAEALPLVVARPVAAQAVGLAAAQEVDLAAALVVERQAGAAAVATTTGGAVATTNSTAPTLSLVQTDSGPAFQFTYNSNNAASLGTVTPHDFAVQSTQAINIPPRIRVFQNNRNAEAAGAIMPVSSGRIDSGRADGHGVRLGPASALHRELGAESRRGFRHAGSAVPVAGQSRPASALARTLAGRRHTLRREYRRRGHHRDRPGLAYRDRQADPPANSLQRQLRHSHAAHDRGDDERHSSGHVRWHE